MASDDLDALHGRGRSLEEEFFKREDAKLLDKLRALKNAETTRELISRATGITNKERLDKLMELKIGGETAAALSVLPLVEVAWADGSIDAKEREYIIAHAATKGFVPGTTEYALLEVWLEKRPEPRFFVAWTTMVHGLSEALSDAENDHLKKLVLDRARGIASASGGLLGMGKISASESAMLAKLEKVFARGK